MFRMLLAGIDVGGVGLLFVLVVGVLVVFVEVDLFVEILWLFFFGGLVGVSDVVLVLPVDVLLIAVGVVLVVELVVVGPMSRGGFPVVVPLVVATAALRNPALGVVVLVLSGVVLSEEVVEHSLHFLERGVSHDPRP